MKKKVRIFFTVLIAAVFAAALIRLFIFETFKVSGISMIPSIRQGETIYVDKLNYGLCQPFGDKLIVQWKKPEQGDVVIYLYNNRIVVKRCAATEGTPLEYSTDNGYNLIVGDKTYQLTEEQYHMMSFSTKVPDKTILAIGDNQKDSIDSRTYGFIPVNNILGKVLFK